MASLLPEQAAPETSRAFKPQARQFGDYILGAQLGSGGMGIVYQARQVSLNREVAIKFIRDSQVASPTLLRRFTIEAEAAARLHHPNIVAIHEIGEIDGQPYFSMDLVEGESLRTRIAEGEFAVQANEGTKSNGRSAQVVIARLMAKTARAVHHAHQRGVLHRDIKPANILLDKNREPILTDFGLARILQETAGQTSHQRLTGSGDIAGTPSYMSPEQACSGEVGNAADIYGLGAVLYELLTGSPPFAGNSMLDILQQVQKDQPKSPRNLNRLIAKDLATICMKCLEKDPRHRFSSAEEFAKDLEDWIEHKPIRARPAGTVTRLRQWTKRNPAGTGLIAALFIGFAGALVLVKSAESAKRAAGVAMYLLSARSIDQLDQLWQSPSSLDITVTSEDLDVLDYRTPEALPDALRLTLGATIPGSAVSYAQENASFCTELRTYLSRKLERPVQLNLRLFKRGLMNTDPAPGKEVDFMIMDPVSYLRAKETNSGISAISRLDETTEAVLMVTNSGLNQITALKGNKVFFPELNAPMTVFAKARLVDAGILKKDVIVTNFVNYSQGSNDVFLSSRAGSRDITVAVLKGRVDAGVTYSRRYEQEKHHGLVALDHFKISATVIVARAGLDPVIVAAFREALLKTKGSLHRDKRDDPSEWGGRFPSAVPIDNDSYFEPLRKALKKARQFDGEP